MEDKQISDGKYLGLVINGELHTSTHSLEMDHLGLAVDLMRMSRSASKSTLTGWQYLSGKRYSLSSVLHSFCALESTINYLGYEMFIHKESKIFIDPNDRGPLLKRFVNSWDKIPVLEKLEIVLSQSGCGQLPANLENELRELNSLRNWITHGFSYTTTFLLEPKEFHYSETDYEVVDSEDSIDWGTKFPNTKFKQLNLFDFEDAKVALRIVLEVFKIISECFDKPFSLITCEEPSDYKTLFKESFDIIEVLES